LAGVAEELDLHLLELAAAEGVVPRVDLVAERLADLGDTERQLEPSAVEDVTEVDEDALSRLWAQIGNVRGILDGADVGLEHQVELARLRQFAIAPRRGAGAFHVCWCV